MVQFCCYFRQNLGIETVSCRLLLRMAMMDMDSNFRKIAPFHSRFNTTFFQVFILWLQNQQKNYQKQVEFDRPGERSPKQDSRCRRTVGSSSKVVFERRTSTGSGLFSSLDGVFAQIFSQIASITVKKLRNTNFISSRHVKRENASLPVDVRLSKTPLLKLSSD